VLDLATSTRTGANDDAQPLPVEWTERFGLVLCNAVLEHVRYPQAVVDDFHRVLAPGGCLYLEVAFWQPFFVVDQRAGDEFGAREDYWRATVEGLRVWAAAFDEISSGWANEGVAYYFGRKPGS
jgi:SAM-dependent methyltransferase